MKISSQDILNILAKQNFISEGDKKKIENNAKALHVDVVDYLLSNNLITKDLIGQAIAENYKVPYADLNSKMPSKEQVLIIPEEVGIKLRVIVFSEDKNKVTLTTDSPNNIELQKYVEKNPFKKKTIIAYSLSEDIDEALANYKKTLETRFSKIIAEKKSYAANILDEIFNDAINFKASDVHFEPEEKEVVIRFRIDSVLQEAGRIPKEYYENIVNRIKIKSHLRTDEHFSAQDGSMRFSFENTEADMRISIVPTIEGETIVIRVLSQYVRTFSLSDLGLSPKDQMSFEEASRKPFGMILVVGPTGSGKSTTLYALLRDLNKTDVNITTIEDPVEYKIVGINQIQVNPQTNLTFAKGLKSIVRQDPNIILVGEIRDTETAEISVNAALTGHLLLSTFHSNDAATGIPRLLDMNVEPFLLSSTMEMIMAQRLVRKICDNCKVSIVRKSQDIKKEFHKLSNIFTANNYTFYRGKGCSVCNNTGFKGRIAIFELIQVTPEMRDLILKRPSAKEVWDMARRQGAHSMFEDGFEKVKNGITTLEEVLRVSEPPQDLIYGQGNKINKIKQNNFTA